MIGVRAARLIGAGTMLIGAMWGGNASPPNSAPAAPFSVFATAPASARVVQSAPHGFATETVITINAPPQRVWDNLLRPARWWDPAHSWSGDARNLSLSITPMGQGCFCERLPVANGGSKAAAGHVVHARVVYAEPGGLLRLSGALGPLQAEGLTGALTFVLEPVKDGTTTLRVTYVVGGYAQIDLVKVAPLVDAVLAGQVKRLAAVSEGRVP